MKCLEEGKKNQPGLSEINSKKALGLIINSPSTTVCGEV